MSGYTSSSYRTALVAASFRGDREGVQSLLDMPLPEDVTQPMRKTFCNVSLLKAAHGNHPDVVRILLAAGALVSNANTQGNTALHIAAQQGHMRVSTRRRVNSSKTRARFPPPYRINPADLRTRRRPSLRSSGGGRAPHALLEALRVTTPIPFSHREAAGGRGEGGIIRFFFKLFFLSVTPILLPDTTPSPPLACYCLTALSILLILPRSPPSLLSSSLVVLLLSLLLWREQVVEALLEGGANLSARNNEARRRGAPTRPRIPPT